MSRHQFECNGYTIIPFGVRTVSTSQFTAFGQFRKDGRSVNVSYPGLFATEEIARDEVRLHAPADALSAPNERVPF